jgi:hypothetical protein
MQEEGAKNKCRSINAHRRYENAVICTVDIVGNHQQAISQSISWHLDIGMILRRGIGENHKRTLNTKTKVRPLASDGLLSLYPCLA